MKSLRVTVCSFHSALPCFPAMQPLPLPVIGIGFLLFNIYAFYLVFLSNCIA